MSKYTTEVRYICEHYAGLEESEGYEGVEEIISKSRTKIFDFSYPIFDESYREILETKILTHYYTREIGLETVGLWKHFLKMRMNEIMPYYNKLYQAELLMPDNPFDDTDYTREGERHDTGEGKENTSGNSAMTGTVVDDGESTSESGGSDTVSGQNEPKRDTWTLYSDTPQGGVAGISAAEASVGSNAYLTNATHVIENGVGSENTETTEYGRTIEGTNDNTRTYDTNNETTSETNRNSKNDGEYEERIHGKMGHKSYAQLIKEYRDTMINIDMLIIRDLGDLFMCVY